MMILTIGKRRFEVSDFAGASEQYARCRDLSGEGMSSFPEGKISVDGKQIGRVSYNARIWAISEWRPNDVALFDPYVKAA